MFSNYYDRLAVKKAILVNVNSQPVPKESIKVEKVQSKRQKILRR